MFLKHVKLHKNTDKNKIYITLNKIVYLVMHTKNMTQIMREDKLYELAF